MSSRSFVFRLNICFGEKKYADKVVLLNKKVLAVGSSQEVFESAVFEKEFGVGGK